MKIIDSMIFAILFGCYAVYDGKPTSLRILQWCSYQNHQSPVYDMKWGHFDRVNSTFKMLLFSWNFDTVFKKIRSFDAENLGSVDLRAAKLLAVKVGDLKKKSASQPLPHPNQSAWVRCPARSNHSQSLMAGNFATFGPTDLKFSALRDLNCF